MNVSALRLRLVWRELADDYLPAERAPRVTDALLARVERRCRAALAKMPPFAARPFAFPPELRAFHLLAQQRVEPARAGEAFAFVPCHRLDTVGLEAAAEARGDSTPWLEFGSFDDHRAVFVCCDAEHALFGALVEREDDTPWASVVYEDETWPSVTDFLASLAAG